MSCDTETRYQDDRLIYKIHPKLRVIKTRNNTDCDESKSSKTVQTSQTIQIGSLTSKLRERKRDNISSAYVIDKSTLIITNGNVVQTRCDNQDKTKQQSSKEQRKTEVNSRTEERIRYYYTAQG